MRPLIGITSGTLRNKEHPEYPVKYGQASTYCDAISQAGGIPFIIPIVDSDSKRSDMLGCLDGVLFSGGNDISPSYYGQEIRYARDLDCVRDEHESKLMKDSLGRDIPILAICRGMQMLNVVHGGTLYQDILQEAFGAVNHDGHNQESGLVGMMHNIAVVERTKLSRILGARSLQANSFHHQAVDRVGDGLIVTARSSDGIIEGVEASSGEFVVGVQAHPEELVTDSGLRWNRLFKAFIKASTTQEYC